jgi:hypothetical protein
LAAEENASDRRLLAGALVKQLADPIREIIKISSEPASMVLRKSLKRIPNQLLAHRASLSSVPYESMVIRFKERLKAINPIDPGDAVKTILWGSAKQEGLFDLLVSNRRTGRTFVDEVLDLVTTSLAKQITRSYRTVLGEANGRIKEMSMEVDRLLEDILLNQKRILSEMDQCDVGDAAIKAASHKAREAALNALADKLERGLEPDATVYYQREFKASHIHFSTEEGVWTNSPGVPMRICSFDDYAMVELDLNGAVSFHACFTDGDGNWDNNYGENYHLPAGQSTIRNGVIYPGHPITISNS